MLEEIAPGRYRVLSAGAVSNLAPDGKTGAIQMDDGSAEIFFHRTALVGLTIGQVVRGDRVLFTLEPSANQVGTRYATHVRRAEKLGPLLTRPPRRRAK